MEERERKPSVSEHVSQWQVDATKRFHALLHYNVSKGIPNGVILFMYAERAC